MRRFAVLGTLALAACVGAPGSVAAQGLVAFQSPSRNIGCQLYMSTARCDIGKRDWSPPKKPKSCPVDYGQGLAVSRNGTRGRFVCAGDTVLGAGQVLAYGRSITRGGITCTSRQSGMTCTNARGHGFRLSRGSYRRF